VGLRSRRKGASWERELANKLRAWWPSAKRGIGQARSAKEVCDVEGTPFWWEAKHGAQTNPRAALRQAEAATDGRPCVAVCKDDRDAPFVCLRLNTFLDLFDRADERPPQMGHLPKLPILSVDFDGVLHRFNSGWQGGHVIPDPPVPGAMEFLTHAVEVFHVAIFSSRSSEEGGVDAMRAWLARWGCPSATLAKLHFPTYKPAAHVSLDDRGWRFDGAWPALEELRRFAPWHEQR